MGEEINEMDEWNNDSEKWLRILGQGKITAAFSANNNVLSATSPPAGTTLM